MTSSNRAIASMLVELADTLVADFDVVDFAQRLCMHGADLLDMGAAGVMLLDEQNHLQVLAASSEEVEMLEMFEIQREVGPCVESFQSGQTVHAGSHEELLRRWPTLGQRVVEHYGAVYAFPMRWRGSMLGALGLYGAKPGSLNPEDVPIGQALADIATISLLQNEALHEATVRSQQLQGALNSRIIIEQAKGKYAERHDVGIGVAFGALRRYAQTTNTKLVKVAQDFVDGDLVL